VFLAERYLRRRYWEGFAEGFAEEEALLGGVCRGVCRGFDEPTPAEQEARNRPQDYR
jgi:hypothetical protein